jgi:ElaB/YqjD/DUF883 family membrane-anchored ribosome-binding protein
MPKNQNDVRNITDAIDRLEKAGQSKTQDLKNMLEDDVEKIKKSLQEITPYLNDIKNKVEEQAHKAKQDVETQVKENPWVALGIVGLVALFIGWLLGHNTKRRD